MAVRCRLLALSSIVLALSLSCGAGPVTAQTTDQAPVKVPPNTTPPQPSAAQPTLPSAKQAAPAKPSSPVVEEIVRGKQPVLDVRKGAARTKSVRPRRVVRHRRGPRRYALPPVDRPALAGVQLTAPLPPAIEPPHIVVPTPAYPVEAVLAGITTPPPPIVCHHTRRDPYAPDPHLSREVPVECEPDNP